MALALSAADLLAAIPLVFAITVHEVAHGWMARRCGDPTAESRGRLTLNPLRHVDAFGTVILPALLYFSHAGVVFGWAKPVPVDWRNLRDIPRDVALVAAAGPLANLCMGLGWFALGLAARAALPGPAGELVRVTCLNGIMFNATIMLLNLIPIPPLDGSRIVTAALPRRAAVLYNQIEPFGLIVIALLLFSRLLDPVLDAPLAWVEAYAERCLGV